MTKKQIVKEAPVHLAWSPKNQYPIKLAAGTAAQRLDSSFNTSSALIELYEVDLTGPSIDLTLLCTFKADHRFHKLIWGDYSDKSVIVGGCDSGVVSIYDANQLVNGRIIDDTRTPTQEEGLIASLQAHSDAVRALDFTLQRNLLATGTSASEIFIWDLSRELIPIQQLASAEPLNDIASLSSNKQVPHIIATAFATQCLVWDLRTSKSIIKLSDSSSKIRWNDIKWNPETGSQHTTQLCLASEEDQCPIIQMWDLRSATSPIKIFEGHSQGVLALDWSDADPEIMISSGKDDKILVWNMNTSTPMHGEIIREIPLSTEWNFEVNWCPRNPSLISSSSGNGAATILTWVSDESQSPSDPIADSFPGVDQHQQPAQIPPVVPGKAPKWIKKTSGVSFGFGGKLSSFSSQNRAIEIFQVTTEPNLDKKFKELDNVLEGGDVHAHCVKKYETAGDPEQKKVWNFMAGQFYGDNFKEHMYTLLGVSKLTLQERLSSLNIKDLNDEETSCDPSSNISHIGPAEDIFNTIAAQQNSAVTSEPPKPIPLKIPENNDTDGAISEALLLGNQELAIDLCLRDDKIADAFALAMSRGPELLAKVQSKYFEKTDNPLTALVSTVLTEDWFNVVDTCDISSWKQMLIALLTYTKGGEFRVLCESLGTRLANTEDGSLKQNAVVCFILAGNVNKVIENYNRTASGSAMQIQEAVELGLLMREAMKARSIEVPVYGAFSRAILSYAELLASQGYLTEAYSYLGESNEESVQELKDRLMTALGLKTAPQETTHAATNGYSHPQQQYQAHNQNHYGAEGDFQSTQNHLSNPTTKPHEYNQPANAPAAYAPSMTNQPRAIFPAPNQAANSIPPALTPHYNLPAHYPTPPNATPGHNQYTQPTSASFVPTPMPTINSQSPPSMFAPSVSSTLAPNTFYNPPTSSQFNQYNNFAPIPPARMSPLPRSAPTPTPPAPNTFYSPQTGSQFNQYNNSVPLPSLGASPMPRGVPTPTPTPPPPFSTQPSHPRPAAEYNVTQSRSKYVIDPSVKGGVFGNTAPPITHQPTATSVPQFAPNSNFYPQPNQNNFYAPGAPQQNTTSYAASPQIMQPSQMEIPSMLPTPIPAQKWNDPPPMGTTRRMPDQQPTYVAPAPISHPMYGSTIPANNMANRPPPIQNVAQSNSGFGYERPSAPQTNYIENHSEQSNYQNNVSTQPGIPHKQPIYNTPAPVPKPALPEQHIVIQTVLEKLRDQCASKNSNLQMRRKLDDTSRKLETLYDAIRDSKLSPRTLQGLHDLVKAIENGNYPECLSLHYQLVSGPDFSAISSFMPGIKVLVQSAMQLGVVL